MTRKVYEWGCRDGDPDRRFVPETCATYAIALERADANLALLAGLSEGEGDVP